LELIPAIDLLDGGVVRLVQGDYGQRTQYPMDPVELVSTWVAEGAEWVHIVDLNAAKSLGTENRPILERILKETHAKLEFGGGVRSMARIQELLDLGVARVVLGTALIENQELRELAFSKFGDQVAAGLDARDGMLGTHGWTKSSGLDAVEFAVELEKLGAKVFVVTDIATDGTLQGPGLGLLQKVREAVQGYVVASGGVSSVQDLIDLKAIGVDAAIMGRAVLDGRFTVREAKEAIR
jgi:phosphoribosylformimino-5-aminoimidazole carboxamide ribotide isomerase